MTVELKDIKKLFSKEKECLIFLEKILWQGKPICPYCPPNNQVYVITSMQDRYHCNGCNSSFSVTVKTIFARTRCDLRKWFLAIYLQTNPLLKLSARELGKRIKTTKDTALLLSDKIWRATIETPSTLNKIVEYINQNLIK